MIKLENKKRNFHNLIANSLGKKSKRNSKKLYKKCLNKFNKSV